MRKYPLRSVFLLAILATVLLNHCFTVSAADNAASNLYGDSRFQQKMKSTRSYSIKSRPAASSGRIYYTAKNGKNSNPGTRKKPFKDIQTGIKHLKKGDTLVIRKGTYREALSLSARGSKNAYITIRSAPGETVRISGKGKQSPILLNLKGCRYIQISGLIFQDAAGLDSCGVSFSPGTNHILFTHNEIKNITVPRPSVPGHCANGILLLGDSSSRSIHNIFLYKNKISDCKTGWGEAVSITGNTKQINVTENTVNNTGNIGIDFSGNYGYCREASRDFPRYCTASGNRIRNCHSPVATSYGLYVDGGQHILLTGNTITSCSGGIEIGAEQKAPLKYATSHITISNNTLKNNTENGISIGGYEKKLGWVTHVSVSGNTCKNNGKRNAILTLAKCRNVTISGNCFSNSSGGADIVYSEFPASYTKNITFNRNRYYNGNSKNSTSFYFLGKHYTKFSAWQKAVSDSRSRYQK